MPSVTSATAIRQSTSTAKPSPNPRDWPAWTDQRWDLGPKPTSDNGTVPGKVAE